MLWNGKHRAHHSMQLEPRLNGHFSYNFSFTNDKFVEVETFISKVYFNLILSQNLLSRSDEVTFSCKENKIILRKETRKIVVP